MMIGGMDKKTSKRLQVQKKWKLLEVARCENRKKAKNAAEDIDHAEEDDSSDSNMTENVTTSDSETYFNESPAEIEEKQV